MVRPIVTALYPQVSHILRYWRAGKNSQLSREVPFRSDLAFFLVDSWVDFSKALTTSGSISCYLLLFQDGASTVTGEQSLRGCSNLVVEPLYAPLWSCNVRLTTNWPPAGHWCFPNCQEQNEREGQKRETTERHNNSTRFWALSIWTCGKRWPYMNTNICGLWSAR